MEKTIQRGRLYAVPNDPKQGNPKMFRTRKSAQ